MAMKANDYYILLGWMNVGDFWLKIQQRTCCAIHPLRCMRSAKCGYVVVVKYFVKEQILLRQTYLYQRISKTLLYFDETFFFSHNREKSPLEYISINSTVSLGKVLAAFQMLPFPGVLMSIALLAEMKIANKCHKRV